MNVPADGIAHGVDGIQGGGKQIFVENDQSVRFFLLLGMEFTLRFFDGGKQEKLSALLSGVCGGLMFGFRQPCGLTALISALLLGFVLFSVDRRRSLRYTTGFAAGFFSVCAVFVVIITIWGAWRDYFIQTWSNALSFAVKRGAGGGYSDMMNNFFPFVTGDRGFVDAVFAFFPLVTLFFFGWLFISKKWKDSLPMVAVILFALGAWHQYYPVPCMRHLYWAGVPMMGIFVYVLKQLWQNRDIRTRGAVVLLVLILLVPAAFRGYFACRRIAAVEKRETVNVPGVRGLLLFSHEAKIISIFNDLNSFLPPEIARRGVFNHTPDGIWSVILAPCDFKHPLYCRIGETIYPDYDKAAFRYCLEKRPAVISSVWKQLPGYVTLQTLTYNGVDYSILLPER